MANVALMVDVANQVVARAHHYMKVHENQGGRKGGYLTVLNHRKGELSLQAKIGQVPADEVRCHQTLSTEKVWRLCRNTNHQTSFETRDEKAMVTVLDLKEYPRGSIVSYDWGHWGGAVRGKKYILGFHGFPELLDEAMMIVLAAKLGDLSLDEMLEKYSARNSYLQPFAAECHWTD